MTVTTDEAAHIVGVSSVTIRRWVMKGWLRPLPVLDPARTHHLFMPDDVVRCRWQHRSSAERLAFAKAQAEWRACLLLLDN